MLSFFAAVSAPLRIRSQNESPGTSCVIIAMVTRGVSAVPPPIPPPVSRGLPPVLEHDAIPTTSTLAAAMAASRLNLIVSPCHRVPRDTPWYRCNTGHTGKSIVCSDIRTAGQMLGAVRPGQVQEGAVEPRTIKLGLRTTSTTPPSVGVL